MKNVLFLVLIFPIGLRSQTALKASRQAQFAYSKYDKEFFVLDDSTNYYTYNPKVGKWKEHNLILDLSDAITFKDFKHRFYPLAIGKGHYLFVQDGCGMVYELKKDTIKRIDQSYDQKHQFGAAIYAYKGVPYMFGGYGLFRTKNLHSYFDRHSKEWFEVENQQKIFPSERDTPYIIQLENEVYFLGGITHQRNKFRVLNDIWLYSHFTNKWNLLGELNPHFITSTRKRGFVQNKDYSIFTFDDKLFLVDVLNNKYYKYVSDRYYTFHRIVADVKKEFVLAATHNSANNELANLEVVPLKKILFGNHTEYSLYSKTSFLKNLPSSFFLWLSILFNVILMVVIFLILRKKKTVKNESELFLLKQADFTIQEWRILVQISQNKELELSALNQFFDESGLSFETLKKRRESFIKGLRVKLALYTRREVETILVETKHPLDKRMKVITWNPELRIEDN